MRFGCTTGYSSGMKRASTRSAQDRSAQTKRRMAVSAALGGDVSLDDEPWEPPPDLRVFVRDADAGPSHASVVSGVDPSDWLRREKEPWVVRWADEEIPVDVSMRLGLAEGRRLVCTGLLIEAREGTELSSREVRRVSLGTVLADFRDQYDWGPKERAPAVIPARQGAPPLDDQFLHEVVRRWQERRDMGRRAPIKDLARHYGKTEATIHRWLQRARDKGFLKEGTRTPKGGR